MAELLGLMFTWIAIAAVLSLAVHDFTLLLSGKADTRAEFMAGVGGLLFIVGLTGLIFDYPLFHERDVDRIARGSGVILLLMPRLADMGLKLQYVMQRNAGNAGIHKSPCQSCGDNEKSEA